MSTTDHAIPTDPDREAAPGIGNAVKTLSRSMRLAGIAFVMVRLLRRVETTLPTYPTVTLMNVMERFVYGQATFEEFELALTAQLEYDDMFMHSDLIPPVLRYQLSETMSLLYSKLMDILCYKAD